MRQTVTLARLGVVGLLVASATVAGVAGVGAATGSQSDVVTLTVTVVDRSGNPISDAELSATWDGGGPVNETTASNGKAFVDVADDADVTIRVDHPFYLRNDPYVVSNAEEQEVEIETARRGRATVEVDDQTGPVDDAIVRLFKNGQLVVNARTDAEGRHRSKPIEQGEYTLITYKEGYARNRTTLAVGSNTTQTMRIEEDSTLVTFRVTDDHFDPPRPLGNANVTLAGIADVTTQGTGQVTVSVPVNDQYDVRITKPGYGTVRETVSVRESEDSLNVSVQRTPELSLTVENDRVLVGSNVRLEVDDEYGQPVNGASVTLDGSSVGETDEEGVVRVPVESTGLHTITVTQGDLESTVSVTGVEAATEDTATATTAPPTTTGSSGFGPGPGLVGATLAVALAVALLARRD